MWRQWQGRRPVVKCHECQAEVPGRCSTGSGSPWRSGSRGWRFGQLAFRQQCSQHLELARREAGQGAFLGFTAVADVESQRHWALAAAGPGVTGIGPDKGFCCVPAWCPGCLCQTWQLGEEGRSSRSAVSPWGLAATERGLTQDNTSNVTSLRKQSVLILIIYFLKYFIKVQFLEFK